MANIDSTPDEKLERRLAYLRAYYAANREKAIAYQHERRAADPGRARAYNRAYNLAWRARNIDKARATDRTRYAKNPEKVIAANRALKAKNPERYLAARRARRAVDPGKHNASVYRWRAKHPEKHRAANRKSYAANPEEKRAKNRAWAVANREKVNDYARISRSRKRSAPEVERVVSENVFNRDDWRCQLLLKCYGRVVKRATRHQCQPNDAHIDHVLPLSRGGSHTYDNVVTACAACNLYKGNLTLGEARERIVQELTP